MSQTFVKMVEGLLLDFCKGSTFLLEVTNECKTYGESYPLFYVVYISGFSYVKGINMFSP